MLCYLAKQKLCVKHKHGQINPQSWFVDDTHTIEVLGVSSVNVHPVLAIVDSVEVPGCGEQSTETSRRYLRHLILVLWPVFPHMDLCVGFQLHAYTYTRMYNTQTGKHQHMDASLWTPFRLRLFILCFRFTLIPSFWRNSDIIILQRTEL